MVKTKCSRLTSLSNGDVSTFTRSIGLSCGEFAISR